MKCRFCGREIAENSIFCNWCGEKQLKTRKKKESIRVPVPRQLPSGKWNIQLKAEGQSITEDTPELCITRARAIRAGFLETHPRGLKTPTLLEAMDKYLADKDKVLSPSTLYGYRTIRDNHFKTAINTPIDKITNWQELINTEADEFSAKTVRNAWGFAAAVLSYAGVTPPRVSLPQVVRAERPWLDPEEILAFVPALKGKPCEIGALLALHSLRRSEIYALTWDNIDLKKNCINVRGALVSSGKSEYTLKETNKTSASRRTVPIMIPELTAALKAAKKSGAPLTPENPRTLGNQINSVCRRLGLPQVTVHGLRHSFASLAYHLGMPEKECQILGGWSDSQTMHKIYTHLYERDLAKHANKMTGFYKNKGAKKPSKSKPPLAKPLAK